MTIFKYDTYYKWQGDEYLTKDTKLSNLGFRLRATSITEKNFKNCVHIGVLKMERGQREVIYHPIGRLTNVQMHESCINVLFGLRKQKKLM